MKTPNCTTCNDTGHRDPTSFYLDCTDCDVAEQRVALNKFAEEQKGISLYQADRHWAIHQRALAMAPKQEAPARKPIGMVAKSSFASHKVLVATDQLDDVPLGAKLYLAAPAAANGAMPDVQAELNVARALLREALKQDDDGDLVLSAKFESKIRSYLDACDKPGGPT